MISYLESFKKGLRVDPIQSGWKWADEYLYLPQKGNPLPGKFFSDKMPPLREIAEALSIDNPTQIVDFMKGVQIGGTTHGIISIMQRMSQAPCDIIAVFPNLELAKKFSRDKLTATIEATPCMNGLLKDSRERDSDNLILSKDFIGGSINIATANSSAALRMASVAYTYFEEVDEYKYDLKGQGNPIEIGSKRSVNFSRKKSYRVSTPTEKGASEIEKGFYNGTQEYCYVPCPFCDFYQIIKWENLKWEGNKADTVKLKCVGCEKLIDERYKTNMLERYVWKAHAKPIEKHRRSFHLASLYSPLGWLSWEACVDEWLRIKDDRSLLKTFVNTILGETFEEIHERIDNLSARRENYIGVHSEVIVLTCGVDIQKNRLEALVVGWGLGERCWTVEQAIFLGSPADPLVWEQLDLFLQKKYMHPSGVELRIVCTMIDTAGGFEKQAYKFCEKRFGLRILAGKGASTAGKPIVSRPTTTNKGKVPLHLIGTDTAKRTLFARLKLTDSNAMGYIHFHKELDDEFFAQLTAEKLVLKKNKLGYKYYAYEKIRDRNEAIDLFVYNMAALEVLKPNWVKMTENFNKLKALLTKEIVEKVEVIEQKQQVIEPKIEQKQEEKPEIKPKIKTNEEITNEKRQAYLESVRGQRPRNGGSIRNW